MDKKLEIMVVVSVHQKKLLLGSPKLTIQSIVYPLTELSTSCKASSPNMTYLKYKLYLLIALLFWYRQATMTVLQICAKKVTMKNEVAHTSWNSQNILPVSMAAVLNINRMPPEMPAIRGVFGWYDDRFILCYCVKVHRKKQLVSHPSTSRAEPEMVLVRKIRNQGQCWATWLIVRLGKGGQWWQYWDCQQMTTRLIRAKMLPRRQNQYAANDPLNIDWFGLCNHYKTSRYIHVLLQNKTKQMNLLLQQTKTITNKYHSSMTSMLLIQLIRSPSLCFLPPSPTDTSVYTNSY